VADFNTTKGEFRLPDGNGLRKRRVERGVSQDHVARAVGISRPRLSRLETGVLRTSEPEVEAIFRAIDVLAGGGPK
jgi:predicted transcriptional regulator